MTERRDDTLCDAPLLVPCPANIDDHIMLARDSGESLLRDIIRNEGCVMESAMLMEHQNQAVQEGERW